MGSPAPPKKLNPEFVRLTDSDEDPPSSSGDDGSCSAATGGDDDAPAPSDGDLGQASFVHGEGTAKCIKWIVCIRVQD